MGLHARPAGLLVKEAAKNACNVTVAVNGTSVDAKRIMGVMKLAAKQGMGEMPPSTAPMRRLRLPRWPSS